MQSKDRYSLLLSATFEIIISCLSILFLMHMFMISLNTKQTFNIRLLMKQVIIFKNMVTDFNFYA